MPSGYFRDLQLIKENFLPAFDSMIAIIDMVEAMVSSIKVNTDILSDERYRLMFSVEEVNRLAREGMPFRDAYKKVGLDIENGCFIAPDKVSHTHAGSIGNLCNDRIKALYGKVLSEFKFDTYHEAFARLLGRENAD